MYFSSLYTSTCPTIWIIIRMNLKNRWNITFIICTSWHKRIWLICRRIGWFLRRAWTSIILRLRIERRSITCSSKNIISLGRLIRWLLLSLKRRKRLIWFWSSIIKRRSFLVRRVIILKVIIRIWKWILINIIVICIIRIIHIVVNCILYSMLSIIIFLIIMSLKRFFLLFRYLRNK